ncbi:MAG: peptidoglycan DD-metalloendopeptidase family protein [Gammaproteobacteria bacterium]
MSTVGLCCVLLAACASSAVDEPESYVVRPQDTLYSIAWRHDLDFRDLARWNNIGADFHISVGQVLILGGPSPAAPSQRAEAAVSGGSMAPAGPVIRRNDVRQGARPAAPAGRDLGKWVWPTDRSAAPRPVSGGGILLTGRLGQDVRAANTGRVVYTGSGLLGYGNLVIIKHADSLLSAYAHNRDMLVHDGQEVAAGQVIAHMGQGAKQIPVLYFEIRHNGKPVDPLAFLSR